jgi:Domain of unknown function (DUF1814).
VSFDRRPFAAVGMLLVDDFELFRQFVVELLGKDRNYRSIYVNMRSYFASDASLSRASESSSNPSSRLLIRMPTAVAEMPVVSFADLYGGKIVDALGRQHPRDLFDVRDLLAREGIDDKLRKAFINYLLSRDRPMAEILAPQLLDVSAEYKRGFEGMTRDSVTLADLLKARQDLIADIVGGMPEQHKHFLISVKRGEPDWALLDLPGAKDLPAVRWKLAKSHRRISLGRYCVSHPAHGAAPSCTCALVQGSPSYGTKYGTNSRRVRSVRIRRDLYHVLSTSACTLCRVHQTF